MALSLELVGACYLWVLFIIVFFFFFQLHALLWLFSFGVIDSQFKKKMQEKKEK